MDSAVKVLGLLGVVSVVQSLSCVQLFATPWIAARQASLFITNSQSLLKLMSVKLVMPSNHLILCCPLLLPSVFPSIRIFSSESVLYIRWPKYWSFSFRISPSNEYSALISFRIDWFDLLAVQGTLKSLLQHHNLKASALQHSAFFVVQLSHPYMTTGKTIALTRWTFVGKVMSLLFNMLSRFVIAFLPVPDIVLNTSCILLQLILTNFIREPLPYCTGEETCAEQFNVPSVALPLGCGGPGKCGSSICHLHLCFFNLNFLWLL